MAAIPAKISGILDRFIPGLPLVSRITASTAPWLEYAYPPQPTNERTGM